MFPFWVDFPVTALAEMAMLFAAVVAWFLATVAGRHPGA